MIVFHHLFIFALGFQKISTFLSKMEIPKIEPMILIKVKVLVSWESIIEINRLMNLIILRMLTSLVVRAYSENKTTLNNSSFSWANQLTSRKINTSRRWSLQGSCEVSISMQLVEIVNNGTNNNKLTTLACLRPLSRYEVSFLYYLWYSRCSVFFPILMSYSCLSGISCVICNILWLTIWSFLLFSLDNDLRRRGDVGRNWIIHKKSRQWCFMFVVS